MKLEYCLVTAISAMNSEMSAVLTNNRFIKKEPLSALSLAIYCIKSIRICLGSLLLSKEPGTLKVVKYLAVVKSGNMNDIFCEIQLPKPLTDVTLLVLAEGFFSKLLFHLYL